MGKLNVNAKMGSWDPAASTNVQAALQRIRALGRGSACLWEQKVAKKEASQRSVCVTKGTVDESVQNRVLLRTINLALARETVSLHQKTK